MKNKKVWLLILPALLIVVFWGSIVNLFTPEPTPQLLVCKSNMGTIYYVNQGIIDGPPATYIINGKIEQACGGGFTGMENTHCPVVSQLEFEWDNCSEVPQSEAKSIWRKVK